MLNALRDGESIASVLGAAGPDEVHQKVANPLKDDPPPAKSDPISSGPQTAWRGNMDVINSADWVIEPDGRLSKDRGVVDPDVVVDMRLPEGQQVTSREQRNRAKEPAKPAAEPGNAAPKPAEQANAGPEKAAGAVSGAGGSSAPSQEKRAPAPSGSPPPDFKEADDPAEAYVEFMRDEFDKATSQTAITNIWSKTREDRRELLSTEQMAALEADKTAAVARIKGKAV
jgi:hypothetical protein